MGVQLAQPASNDSSNGNGIGLAKHNGSNGGASHGAGISSSSNSGAVVFDPANDIVAADLVLVMDKYTAADVLREVSSYDLINPGGHYSARVRLLGSFHPRLAAQAAQSDGQDIDDPLYGNMGGEQQQAAVIQASQLIQESCSNLVQQLEGLAAQHGLTAGDRSARKKMAQEEAVSTVSGSHAAASSTQYSAADGISNAAAGVAANGSHVNLAAAEAPAADGQSVPGAVFRQLLVKHVREEGVIDWLVPPMLQGNSTDLGGWV
eukprot:GHRR01006832.1.p1 GENE.GHRR01006832.1~~GHRR01006832.1.p1  ORF type:complete len:263 (+),score=136.22 GHRR01006832.1:3-791(+)